MAEIPLDPAEPRQDAARRARWWWALLALAAVAATTWWLRRAPPPAAAPEARPVPVTATAAVRRDVPVTLEGLGSVSAFRTVTVRPQVDGRLEQVFFKEGQAVRAGQVLAQIDPRPFRIQLQQAEGALARDTAQLASARLNLDRYRSLAAEKLVAQQQADDQAGLVGQLEGTVRVDQAAIDAARLSLDYAAITSPVDGVTGLRLVDPGNVVHASDAGGLVVVTQLDPIAVLFTLPQDHLPAVAEAMGQGTLEVVAVSRDGVTPLATGQLALVDNQINQATSTIKLKAIFPNPKHALWPNQFVNARLQLAVRRGALVIPATAAQRGPAGTFVYVVGADATVAPRPVELGPAQGDLTVVARGLTEGERVVVDGQSQLRPGSKVAAREPGAAPAAAAGGGQTRGGGPAR